MKKAIKKVARVRYDDGGELDGTGPGTTKAKVVNPAYPPSTVPGTPPTTAVTPVTSPAPATPKPKLDTAGIRKKYANNPYVKTRESWGADLDKQIPASDQTARQAIMQASQATGVNPALLYSSASEEGLNLAMHRPGDASEAYVNWSDKNKELGDKFPVDGFYNYGLDTFGNNYQGLVKKGYLPKDFNSKFTTFDIENEKGEKYKSAAFASDADALTAKAALIRDSQDAVAAYEKKAGVKFTPAQRDFFALAGYNGGTGIIPKIAQSYSEKGYLKDDKFLDPTFKPASYGGVYTNVQRRLQNKAVLENEGYFADGGSMKPKYDDGGPFKPKDNKVANDAWTVVDQPTPQAPKPDPLTVLPVDQTEGTPVDQNPIQPLSQFYDIVNSEFGNKKLQPTGQYVNDQGQVNTPQDLQAQADQVSAANARNAEQFSGLQKGIETAATFAITGINKALGEGNQQAAAAKIRRQQLEQQSRASSINPYLQGNGSQAIFGDGGSIHINPKNKGKFTASAKAHGQSVQGYAAHILANKEDYSPAQVKRANFARNAAKWHEQGGPMASPIEQAQTQAQGVQVLDGGKAKIASTSDHSNPMMEFSGKEHKDGGIGIAFNGGIAEVEDKEMGWVDDNGTLQLFGKLKVPGTNQTFRKAAKDIAETEKKVDDKKAYYTNILNNTPATDPYGETAISTAKVMFKSLDKQSKQIAEQKEAMASYQGLILGLKAQQDEKKMGGWLGKCADGGELGGDPPGKKKTQSNAATSASIDFSPLQGNKSGKFVSQQTDKALSAYDLFNNIIANNTDPYKAISGQNGQLTSAFGSLQGSTSPEEAKALFTQAVMFNQNKENASLNPQQRLQKYYESLSQDPNTQALKDKLKNYIGTNRYSTMQEGNNLYNTATWQGGNAPTFAVGGSFGGGKDDLDKLAYSIAQFESGNDYKKQGVKVTKGKYKGERAIGKYQIMPGNVADWSKEALGKAVTIEEFKNSEAIQDQVAKYKIAQLYRQHKTPESVASAWLTGRPTTDATAANAKDDNGTSGSQYVDKVMGIYNKVGGTSTSSNSSTAKGGPNKKPLDWQGTPISHEDVQKMYDYAKKTPSYDLNTDMPDLAKIENYLGIHGKARKSPETNTYKSLSQSAANQILTQGEQNGTANPVGGVVSSQGISPSGQPFAARRDQNPGIDTPYGKATVQASPDLGDPSISNASRIRGKVSPLDLTQIAPELLSLATNNQEAVPAQLYSPDLKQTFDVSYQLGRNENQSTFNQAAKIAESTGNVDALSQLAAQKYNADQQYNNQEIQGNAQQKLNTYSQNVDILNDAKLKNLQIIANQADKQAAAKFNTRKENIDAFASIEGKVLQNNLENRQYNAYANLFKNYGFDKNGNVTFDPGKVTKLFNEGERQQFGMLAAQKGLESVTGGNAGTKTITTTDGSGNVKKITNIDSDLEEFNTIMGSKNLDETQKRSILSKRKNAIFQDLN